MTDWAEDKSEGCYTHGWCGRVYPGPPDEFNKPTCWVWYDRSGIKRATFSSLAEAKRMARKLSGVQLESEP